MPNANWVDLPIFGHSVREEVPERVESLMGNFRAKFENAER